MNHYEIRLGQSKRFSREKDKHRSLIGPQTFSGEFQSPLEESQLTDILSSWRVKLLSPGPYCGAAETYWRDVADLKREAINAYSRELLPLYVLGSYLDQESDLFLAGIVQVLFKDKIVKFRGLEESRKFGNPTGIVSLYGSIFITSRPIQKSIGSNLFTVLVRPLEGDSDLNNELQKLFE